MKPTCIIVEDHDVVRNLLCDWLGSAFPQVIFTGVSNGEEALQLVQSCEPVLVLMDVSLPGMSGIEVTRQIKQNQPKVYIIIHTIHNDSTYRQHASQVGANAFVPKSQAQTHLIPALELAFAELGVINIGQPDQRVTLNKRRLAH